MLRSGPVLQRCIRRESGRFLQIEREVYVRRPVCTRGIHVHIHSFQSVEVPRKAVGLLANLLMHGREHIISMRRYPTSCFPRPRRERERERRLGGNRRSALLRPLYRNEADRRRKESRSTKLGNQSLGREPRGRPGGAWVLSGCSSRRRRKKTFCPLHAH